MTTENDPKLNLDLPSIEEVVRTKNRISLSAQFLYPYWKSYQRNTMIHLFRADEDSPWKIVILPENDRFTANALSNSEDFEQRYLKFLSGINGIPIKAGADPKATANNAFEALVQCYPKGNQNVPQDERTKAMVLQQFEKSFASMLSPELESPISKPILTPQMKKSEDRARQAIKKEGLTIQDLSCKVELYSASEEYTKLAFGNPLTQFHLHRVGNETIVFAETQGFNSLSGGMLVLSANSSEWEKEISDAWLLQQMNIRLGTLFNPETKSHPEKHYKVQNQIPMSDILKAARDLHKKIAPDLDAQPKPEVSQSLEKIDMVLHSLQGKIGEVNQHHAPKAHLKATELLKTLTEARNEYATNLKDTRLTPSKAGHIFNNKCQIAINDAKPILAKDLGWGDYLKNISKALANAVIKVVSFGQANSFFTEIKAKSLQEVEKAEGQLDLRPGSR